MIVWNNSSEWDGLGRINFHSGDRAIDANCSDRENSLGWLIISHFDILIGQIRIKRNARVGASCSASASQRRNYGVQLTMTKRLVGAIGLRLETGVLRRLGRSNLILDRTPVSYALHPRNSTPFSEIL